MDNSHKDEENTCHIPDGMKQSDIQQLIEDQLTHFLTHIRPYFDPMPESKKIYQTRLLLSDIEYLKIQHADNICGAILESLSNSILMLLHKNNVLDVKTLKINDLPIHNPKTPTFSGQFPELDAAIRDYQRRQDNCFLTSGYRRQD